MTDPTDPKRRRKDASREPPTLDLKATVVDEGSTSDTSSASGRTDSSAMASAGPGRDAPASEATEGHPSPARAVAPEEGWDEGTVPTPVPVGHNPTDPPAALHEADEARAESPRDGETAAATAEAEPAGDGTAVANEGPTADPAATETSGDESPRRSGVPGIAGTASDVDPTVPVADADLSPERTGAGVGAVPPLGGAPSASQRSERRSPGIGSLLAASVLGGLVGAGAIYGLQAWRPSAAQPDPRLTEIERRLSALPQGDAVQGIDRRIGALETAQADLGRRLAAAQGLAERAAARAEEAANRPAAAAPAPATPGPSGSAAPAPVASAPAAPAPTASAPAAPAPAPGADPAAVAALGNRLSTLENQVRNPAAVTELGNRLSSLEEQVRNPAAVTELGNRLGALEVQSREQAQAATAAAEAARSAAQNIERRLAETGQNLERRIGENDQRIGGLTRQLAEWNPEAIRAGLRVVLADRLMDALGEGAPFADVLGSLGRFGIDPARQQALEPVAASGAPTAAALTQGFKPLSERILRESRGEAEGIADRILRMADRVVTVRAVDNPDASSVPGLVTRIENALERGALADAAAAWDALPEPARRVSQDWGRGLKARVAADQAARGIAADSIAALNAAPR